MPPPQLAMPARRGARCGAGAESPRPHLLHQGHTGHGTPTARPRGWAAGGGTGPETRRPSKQWQATPPEDRPPHTPRHAAPTGHASQGDSAGPPNPQNREWRTPAARPEGGQSGERGCLTLTPPTTAKGAPPRGTPFHHPHSAQCQPARAHAMGLVLGPHARTNRHRDTRAAEPQLPAPEDGQSGEGPRLTPHAPHRVCKPRNSAGPPRPHTRAHSTWVAEGERLTPDAPCNGNGRPPRGYLSASARKGTRREAGAGSPGPHQPQPGHTGHGTPAAGRGTAPDCPPQRTGGWGRDSA